MLPAHIEYKSNNGKNYVRSSMAQLYIHDLNKWESGKT